MLQFSIATNIDVNDSLSNLNGSSDTALVFPADEVVHMKREELLRGQPRVSGVSKRHTDELHKII
jgi:hypothetical protein